MKRFIESVRKIPGYGWKYGTIFVLLNMVFYYSGTIISRILGTISWRIAPKIPFIDDKIPIIAIFILPYLLSYAHWLGCSIFASLAGKKYFINYVIGMVISYIIGILFFVFMPTYMDRAAEGLLQFGEQPGFLRFLFRSMCSSDGGRFAFNLFPSFHCLVSAHSYLAVRKREEIPMGVRIFGLVGAVLICLSTVFVKQHYFLDVVGGIGLAAGCYAFAQKYDLASRWFKKLL